MLFQLDELDLTMKITKTTTTILMGFDTMEINLVVVVVVKIVVVDVVVVVIVVIVKVMLWPCLLLLIISYYLRSINVNLRLPKLITLLLLLSWP